MLPVGFRVLAWVKEVRNFGLGGAEGAMDGFEGDLRAELGAERLRAGGELWASERRGEVGAVRGLGRLDPSLPPGSPTPTPKLQKRFLLPKQNRLGSI